MVLATDKPTESFKSFYDDYRVIGKHFRVQWSGKINLSRHYTICNVMQSNIYRAYLEALRTDSDLDQSVLRSEPQDQCFFTVKNYES